MDVTPTSDHPYDDPPPPPPALPQGPLPPPAPSTSDGDPRHKPTIIVVSEHCPPGLRACSWDMKEFILVQKIYQGSISVVFHAVHAASGVSFALKLYRRESLSPIERHQVQREVRMHVDLNHPSIISLWAAWKDRTYVYIALQWAPLGDVYTYLARRGGSICEERAVQLIMYPFLSALAYLHSKGLIHRDIKPENILLDSQLQVKIADFGLSIDSTQEVANTRLGTLEYIAPEILDCPYKNHPLENKTNGKIGYSNKVDCWSCGVLAYELIMGRPPFASDTPKATLAAIREQRIAFPPSMSPEAADFVRRALVRSPEQRATVDQLLVHPWIQGNLRGAAVCTDPEWC